MKLTTLISILMMTSIDARAVGKASGIFETAKRFITGRGRNRSVRPIVSPAVEAPSKTGSLIELGTNVAMAVAAGGTLVQATIENESPNVRGDHIFINRSTFTVITFHFRIPKKLDH